MVDRLPPFRPDQAAKSEMKMREEQSVVYLIEKDGPDHGDR